MIQEKRIKLAALLLKGLTVDEAAELTALLKEERQEWHENQLKILGIHNVIKCDGNSAVATVCDFKDQCYFMTVYKKCDDKCKRQIEKQTGL